MRVFGRCSRRWDNRASASHGKGVGVSRCFDFYTSTNTQNYSYLLKSEAFRGAAEELDLATFCIDYLNLPIFKGPFSQQAVMDGSYGFMEYAVLYWLRHLEAGMSSDSEPDNVMQDFVESLEGLLEHHWRAPSIEPKISKRMRDWLPRLRFSSKYKEIQQVIVSTQEQIKRFGDMRTGECALDLTEVVFGVRAQIESVFANNSGGLIGVTKGFLEQDMKLKYGTNLFKCPRFSCKYFTNGFASREERDSHVQRHERPFRCTDMHCTGFIGFAKEDQLARHYKETHADTSEEEQVFPTEDEVAESQREYVPEVDVAPDDTQPAVAENPAIEANVEMTESVVQPASVPEVNRIDQPAPNSRPTKRAKTQTEFECSHCEKTFSKRYNRDSHLKIHGVGETFSCEVCGMKCGRQSDLTRHMKKHTTEKAFKCGGILSNGCDWGCGQSFLRADILSNHHKSKKGKNCIAPVEEEERAANAAHAATDV